MSELHIGLPQRIKLSRAKGWRMPANTVKIDRSTPWGNPFVAGTHGIRARCVELHAALPGRLICLSCGGVSPEAQTTYRAFVLKNISTLRGKNLACWCALDGPCHADTLLVLANA